MQRQANVLRSVWRDVVGKTKIETSQKPVPLHELVLDELQKWHRTTLYRSSDDYVFPSIVKNGNQPLTPDMILKRHIRPALERIGATKTIGFHSFRHGFATVLRQQGVDLKLVRNL